MPLHRRGEMVTVIHPIGLKDDADRAVKCDVGDILLILKYSKALGNGGRYTTCCFLNARGEFIHNEFEYHHFTPVQFTHATSIID